MAQLKIEQRHVELYGDKYLPVVPKPRHLARRIPIQLPDEVVLSKEEQPVIDAYAEAIGKPELKGKTMDQLRREHSLELGFHLLSFDDKSLSRR